MTAARILRLSGRLAAAAAIVNSSACRAPDPGTASRTEELRNVEQSRVIAFGEDGRLALRFRLKGRDAYAEVHLPDKASDCQSAIEFSRQAKDIFGEVRKRGAAVPVLGPAV